MSTLKILIADDHTTNRTILGMLLDDMELHYAENGQQALDAVRHAEFDVVLMDMEMPVLTGLEATRGIRAFEQEIGRQPTTIVILSANADSESQKQGADAGANGHVCKPIILERLLEGIDAAMIRNKGAQMVNAPSEEVSALTLP